MKAVCLTRTHGVFSALAASPVVGAAAQDVAAAPANNAALWVGVAVLLVVTAMLVVRWLKRARGLEEGASGHAAQFQPGPSSPVRTPRGYSEKNVGNDASARPFERRGPALDAGTAAGSQGGWVGSEEVFLTAPKGFDVESFLETSKINFVTLQAAWNRADTASLRAMMTADMLDQINTQLADREAGAGAAATEVVMLEARLLRVEELDDHHMASVEFSGVLREDHSAGPNPFRELWSITRPKAGGGGWLVAGVQALHAH